jgi:hypothetical protein
MNPYTPPNQDTKAGTVRQTDMAGVPKRKSNRWITVAVYFCVILGIGLAASLLASIFIPNAKLDLPSPNTTGLRAHLAIGAIAAMLVCPVFAGLRHWGVLNYLIASMLALGLLLGNVGSGVPLSLISVVILYGTQRLFFMLAYFKS